jgi:uncharacterized protein YeaO (DUF488 family)
VSKIRIKRVYEAPAASDGIRILVDRLWPRGLRKEAASLDLWCKEIAPSTALRKWFDHRADRLSEFQRRYRAELSGNPAVQEVLTRIGHAQATLLYAGRDPANSHATFLARYLQGLQAKR